MQKHFTFDPVPSSGEMLGMQTNLFARLVRILIAVLSAPRGDQGGWEGGARGL